MAHLHQPHLEVYPYPVPIDVAERIEAMNYHALQRCAEEVAVMFRGYSPTYWFIDRMGHMEFLQDQMFGPSDFFRFRMSQLHNKTNP